MPSKFVLVMYSLAFVVYHRNYLEQILSNLHPRFDTALFRVPNFINSLQKIVRCSLPEKGAPIKATGIPPHTIILKCIKDIEAKLDKSIENQNENAEKVVDGVIQELERRVFGAGTVTCDGLRGQLLACLRSVGC